MNINEITGQIIDAAVKVHSALGPGLLESAYEACMIYELRKRGLLVESQVGLPVEYDGIRLNVGYRVDLLVQKVVIVELKSVEKIIAIHAAQILSYLKLSRLEVGLVINFNVCWLKDGLQRFVNHYSGPAPRSPRPLR